MMYRRLLVATVAAFALAGCSSGEADAAARACGLLAEAQNRVGGAVFAWVAAGRPAGGSDDVRAANAAYADRVAEATDAAPESLAEVFIELERLAFLYDATGSEDAGVAMTLAGSTAVKRCESVGVDMQIVNPRTGVVA